MGCTSSSQEPSLEKRTPTDTLAKRPCSGKSSSQQPSLRTSSSQEPSLAKSIPKDTFTKSLNLGEVLGQGAYATVHMVKTASGDEVPDLAVKVIHQSAHVSRDEASVWHQVVDDGGHSHIVELFQVHSELGFHFFVMERCVGTLGRHIAQQPRMDEAVVAGFLSQMMQALAHVHKRNVVHRDIKPDNLLVGRDGLVKLSDFGLAAVCPPGGCLRDVVGTAPFMSPEMVTPDAGYAHNTDLWSLGAIAHLLLCGEFPYMPPKLNPSAMKRAIRMGSDLTTFRPKPHPLFPETRVAVDYSGPSEVACQLLRSLLTRDPSGRITAVEASSHRFFSGDSEEQHCQIELPDLRPIIKRAALFGGICLPTC